jgi:hypothetical protein
LGKEIITAKILSGYKVKQSPSERGFALSNTNNPLSKRSETFKKFRMQIFSTPAHEQSLTLPCRFGQFKGIEDGGLMRENGSGVFFVEFSAYE